MTHSICVNLSYKNKIVCQVIKTRNPARDWILVAMRQVVFPLGIDIIQYKKINTIVKPINEKPEKIFGLSLHNNINSVVAQRREASTAVLN